MNIVKEIAIEEVAYRSDAQISWTVTVVFLSQLLFSARAVLFWGSRRMHRFTCCLNRWKNFQAI